MSIVACTSFMLLLSSCTSNQLYVLVVMYQLYLRNCVMYNLYLLVEVYLQYVLVVCTGCMHQYYLSQYQLCTTGVYSGCMYHYTSMYLFYEVLECTSFWLYVLVVCTSCMYYVVCTSCCMYQVICTSCMYQLYILDTSCIYQLYVLVIV